jgi:flavin-dependent dehydrogenase
MDPIRILGAGPSGLTAAIILAQAGRSVVVYERAHDVGTRHAGDPNGIESFTTCEDVWAEFAEWGLAQNMECVPVHGGTWFGPGFRGMACLRDSQPLGYAVLRGPLPGSLDRGLLEQARQAGVRVEFNRPATPAEVDIVASGFTRPRIYAVGYNFKTRAPNGAYFCIDDALTPKLYSYLMFVEGRGTVAACGYVPLRTAKDGLPHIVEGFHSRVEFDMREPHYYAALVSLTLQPTGQANGKRYVGEAGGFQDLYAAFGIRMAMTSGYLAAYSLLHDQDYDALWRARFGARIRAAAVNRWLQEAVGNSGYPWLLRYMQRHTNSGRSFLRRLYNPRWYTPLLWPLAKRRLRLDPSQSNRRRST